MLSRRTSPSNSWASCYCLVGLIEQKQWLIHVIKMVATRCRISRLKCTKFWFRLGPHWQSSQCSPESLAGFKGPTSKGREGSGREKGRGGVEKKVERGLRTPPMASITNFWLRYWQIVRHMQYILKNVDNSGIDGFQCTGVQGQMSTSLGDAYDAVSPWSFRDKKLVTNRRMTNQLPTATNNFHPDLNISPNAINI